MADDTTSSPDPSSADPSSPDPSTPEPADEAAEPGVEQVVEQAVDLAAAQPVDEAVEQTVEQTPDAVSPDPVSNLPAAGALNTPPEPSVATTLVVEPTPAPLAAPASPSAGGKGEETGDEEGGEWELLLQKLRQWFNQGELQSLWSQARKPVTLLAALVGLLLVLRVYSAVLGALDSLPLVPGLLELAGVVWTVRYGVPKLLRSSERERLLSGLSNRWKAFRGKA